MTYKDLVEGHIITRSGKTGSDVATLTVVEKRVVIEQYNGIHTRGMFFKAKRANGEEFFITIPGNRVDGILASHGVTVTMAEPPHIIEHLNSNNASFEELFGERT